MKDAFKDAFFNSVVGNKMTTYFYDIYKSWAVLLVASFVSVIIAYLYLFVVRKVGGHIIWCSIAISFITLTGAGLYGYFYARNKYDVSDPTYNYITYASYIVWGLAGCIFIALCCCVSAIQLAIAVF